MERSKDFGFFVVISVVLLLSIAFIIARLTQLNAPPEIILSTASTLSSFLMFFVTFVLVIVTWKYAKSSDRILVETQKTLEETQKDRKIRHVERRLEKLYYPLWQKPITLLYFSGFNSIEAKEDFGKFQYLGSPELKASLNKYHDMRSNDKIETKDKAKELKIIASEIQEIVKREIPILEQKLEELIK